ncbi:OpgC domain-containing protein [Caballeronia sp. J97]|uniref:OpgC domain-containing protein n=1 Tax=Caballeronia sp. J97 TaxID=2805429 RepID=UPI002AAFBB6F|nr:OpgC domain-containing protein [Caballeronia sp. J97]
MSSPEKRSIEVDFLRGIVLIVIALDHNLSGVLQHAMLHTYAYCDAAEVFVFLGGYASASAYLSVCVHRGESAARRRFLKRAFEIYRAYLLTAILMLGYSAALTPLPILNIAADASWKSFLLHPVWTLIDIALFRQQPFLSAVLPMYVVFALCVPLTVPLCRRRPLRALLISLAIWLAAPWLGGKLPSVGGEGWPFNPYAWQLMFTFGTLCRLHPIQSGIHLSARGKQVTIAALAVVLTIASVKLCVDAHPAPGYLKQNLSGVRVLSFLSIAWLCAQAVRLGWVRALAERMPGVVTAGRHGLVCFVGGTILSISADVFLRIAEMNEKGGHLFWPMRLNADVLIIAGLLFLGKLAGRCKPARAPTLVSQGGAHVPHDRHLHTNECREMVPPA